jgi:hypothetical protein
MASVLGRLEERERVARKRVEELQAELEAAQSEWDEWLIARRPVGEVWDGDKTAGQGGEARKTPDGSEAAVPAARPGSVVPPWREGLSVEVLAPEYQQVMGLLAERRAIGGQPLNCREITARCCSAACTTRRPIWTAVLDRRSGGQSASSSRSERCSPWNGAAAAGPRHGCRSCWHVGSLTGVVVFLDASGLSQVLFVLLPFTAYSARARSRTTSPASSPVSPCATAPRRRYAPETSACCEAPLHHTGLAAGPSDSASSPSLPQWLSAATSEPAGRGQVGSRWCLSAAGSMRTARKWGTVSGRRRVHPLRRARFRRRRSRSGSGRAGRVW